MMNYSHFNFVIPHKTRSVADAGPNPRKGPFVLGPASIGLSLRKSPRSGMTEYLL